MPVFIILIWCAASSGLSKLSDEMKRRMMLGSIAVVITCSLLVLHVRHTYYLTTNSVSVEPMRITNTSTVSKPIHKTVYSVPMLTKAETRKPVHHLAYIKTHKTGSSTIWSIIISYAVSNNLTIALPASRKGNKLGWPELFTKEAATPPKPDVLCHHSRFSDAMLGFMPIDTFYFTSMRDPAYQLKSAYTYFNAQRCFNLDYKQFLHKLDEKSLNVGNCQAFMYMWLNNGQVFDLGLDTENLSETKDREKVLDKINEIDKQFGIVIILERLDESLIVLRDFLNWTTEDIVYLKKNFQMKVSGKDETIYTQLEKSVARSWNWADVLAYNHFRDKLDRTIEAHPEYYQEQVKHLQHRKSLWNSRCVKGVVPLSALNTSYSQNYPEATGTYVLTSKGKKLDRCAHLVMTEVAKIRLLNSGHTIDSATYSKVLNATIVL